MEQQERIEQILLSTGNVNKPYIIRDLIFVTERVFIDIFDPNFDPNKALADVAYQLKSKAFSYGATAVINCHFEHERINGEEGPFFEIFAYGTAVQFTQTTIGG
ncbi:heavy metal-binding domain-containing protein [Tetragenococcus solitarius]|uniref:Heavy metal-binding domain-containing protein n=1 Tax=Tetragenococcus solitarius TaxID=71453 RepID=A0ABN3Y2I9_9ENTE|nr:heavy metal-binding domain-containing protein [Tetragenococcus solitarius]